MFNQKNRVVVTGMGVLAPNGIGLQPFWDTLLRGESGIGPITLFDATAFKSRIAGEVKNFQPLDYIDPKFKPRRMARHTQFAFAAMKMAIADAGFDVS
jgi:3-oxoacyl-[acyl-carrier-protein] synthase II